MTTAGQGTRAVASLKIPGRVPALISRAKGIVQAMTGNASFPSPNAALADVIATLAALEDAESSSYVRTRGAVANRNEKRNALVVSLSHLKAYVQTVADANADTAASVIQTAGFDVARWSRSYARLFSAKPGAVSGVVILTAKKAAKMAAYHWQYSTDEGKTWTDAGITLQAKTSVSGLTHGTMASFRYRPVTRAGMGDFSDATSLVVQ